MVDKKDAFAILLIFAICMGLGNMQERSTLPEFLEGISVREAIEGKASPLHSQIAAQFTLIFSAITNFPPTSAQTISQSLLFLSPLILALSSCFLFLSLRFLGFARAVSAFATLVFCIPLCAQQFLPGYYSSTHLALLPFSISVALLSKHSQKAIAGAAIFASISGYLSPAFGIGFAAAAFSFAISSKKEALPLAAICAISLASAFLSPDFPHLSFALPNLQSFFKQFPALVSIGLGG
ncbi:MAG: hypothetical protein QW275_01230, partial [Candidatus Anstonellaceae archaeon]